MSPVRLFTAASAACLTVISTAPSALAASAVARVDPGRIEVHVSHQRAHPHARGLVPRVQHRRQVSLAGANPNCSRCNPPLLFTRGKTVMGGGQTGAPGRVTITPVYWAPPGYSFDAAYRSIIDGYLQNVALASGGASNVFSVMTQYYQQATAAGSPVVHVRYAVSVGGELDDSDAFPSQSSTVGCLADAGFSACVNDDALQAELQALAAGGRLQVSDSNLYVVLLPPGVETCIGYGLAGITNKCSTNAYCAYHSASDASPNLVYSNQPYPDLAHCSDPVNGPQEPNGNAYADDEVSLISHEANEAITDWSGAWMDSAGYENGDECSYVYGTPLGSVAGAQTLYNQVIGNRKYYTQDEFSNEDYTSGRGDLTTSGGTLVPGCAQREESPVASFTAPSSVATGVTAKFDASASSEADNNASGLTYSWSWGDGSSNGTTVTATHAYSAPGTYQVTLTVTDVDGWTGSRVQSIAVTSTRVFAPAQSAGPASPSRQTVAQSSPAPPPPTR